MTYSTYLTMSNQGNWPFILNLANSIIGVSVLATPFCFKQCGILLGTLLLIACGFLTRASCHILLKAAFLSRRRSYEFLALHLFGPTAKLFVEISTIGFLLGICIAFFVVIGDLGPHIISHLFGAKNTETLRIVLLIGIAVCVEFPLSMLRNIKSLSTLSALCVGFYVVFVFKVFLAAIPIMLNATWWLEVNWWRTAGVFRTLPILAMSFSCQTQLFVMYDVLPEPSPKKMNTIISGAVNLCCFVYFCVAFFGYVAFYRMNITGDILVSFESTLLSNLMKVCFLITIVISYPLCVFPCRESVHSLFFKQNIPHDLPGAIPASRFKLINSTIIIITLIVAILVPNVETILGLTGSTMGCAICFILPAVLFIRTQSKPNAERLMAQIVLCLGVFVLVASTYATLTSANNSHDSDHLQNKMRDASNIHAVLSNNQIPKDVKTLKSVTVAPRRQEPPNPNPPVIRKEIIDQPEGPKPVPPNLSLNKQDSVINKIQKKRLETIKKEELKVEEKHNDLIEKLQEQHREQLNIIEQQKQLLHELKQHQKIHDQVKMDSINLKPTTELVEKIENSILLNHQQNVGNLVPIDQQSKLVMGQDSQQQIVDKLPAEKITDLPPIALQHQVVPNLEKIIAVEKQDIIDRQPRLDSQMGNDKFQESQNLGVPATQPPLAVDSIPKQREPDANILDTGLHNIPVEVIKRQEDLMAVNLQHWPVNLEDIPEDLRKQEIAARNQYMAQQKLLAQQTILAQQKENEQNNVDNNLQESQKEAQPLNINLALASQKDLNNVEIVPKVLPKVAQLSSKVDEKKMPIITNVHNIKEREVYESETKRQGEQVKEQSIPDQKLLKDI